MAPKRQPARPITKNGRSYEERYGDTRIPPPPTQDQWANFFAAVQSLSTLNYHDEVAKHHPSNYIGSANTAELTDWIFEIEEVFEKTECPDHKKVRIAATYLKEEAQQWWRTIKDDRLSRRNYDWAAMKDDLLSRFSVTYLRNAKVEEFRNLTMKGKTMEAYYSEFMELSQYLPTELRDETSLRLSFEQGLGPYKRRIISGLGLRTVQETYERAFDMYREYGIVKEQEKEKRTASSGSKNKGKRKEIEDGQGRQWNPPQGHRGQDKGKGKMPQTPPDSAPCFKCNRVHPGRRCSGDPIVCYRCGGKGHKKSTCGTPPSTRNVSKPQRTRNQPGDG